MKQYYLRHNAAFEVEEGKLRLVWNDRAWLLRSGRDDAVSDLAALCTLALTGKTATIFLWSDQESKTLTVRAFCPANARWETALVLFELRCGEQVARTGLGVLGTAALRQMLLNGAKPVPLALQGGVLITPTPEGVTVNIRGEQIVWSPDILDRIARALVLALETPSKTSREPEEKADAKPKKTGSKHDAGLFYMVLPEAELRIIRRGTEPNCTHSLTLRGHRIMVIREDIARLFDLVSSVPVSRKGQVAKLCVV